MFAVIVSTDPDWPAPLGAMLRERGFEIIEARDLVDAMASLRQPGAVAVVVNADVGDDDALAILRSTARRFGDDVRRVGVGDTPAPETADMAHVWVTQPYRYVSIVAAVGAPPDRPGTAEPGPAGELQRIARHSGLMRAVPDTSGLAPGPSPGSAAITLSAARPVDRVAEAAAPPTLSEIHHLLQVARFEPYEALLGVDPSASPAEVRSAANRLLERLDEDRMPDHVVDTAFADIAELRAAIDDAAAVLASPAARDLLRGPAEPTAPAVPSTSPTDGL